MISIHINGQLYIIIYIYKWIHMDITWISYDLNGPKRCLCFNRQAMQQHHCYSYIQLQYTGHLWEVDAWTDAIMALPESFQDIANHRFLGPHDPSMAPEPPDSGMNWNWSGETTDFLFENVFKMTEPPLPPKNKNQLFWWMKYFTMWTHAFTPLGEHVEFWEPHRRYQGEPPFLRAWPKHPMLQGRPGSQAVLLQDNVNPGLRDPKRLFNWEGTI